MEQVAKLKRTWNLAPVLQIVQRISENCCPGLYQSIGQIWWLNQLWFKRYIQKVHLLSCANTHHDITDLVNHEMVKNAKNWISWEQNIAFLQNKKILNMCFRWHVLRSYHFVAEVTFKCHTQRMERIDWISRCGTLCWIISKRIH